MPQAPTSSPDPHSAQRMSLAEASRNPCEGCAASCCTFLPLRDLVVATWSDVDYARYLLNFEHMELALLADGRMRLHYRARCTKLNAEQRCAVHGTPDQPRVCKGYNAYQCGYKPVFQDENRAGTVRMDRPRFEAWAAHLVFNEHRAIIERPDIAALLPHLPPMQAPEPSSPVPLADPDQDAWRASLVADEEAPAPTSHSYASLQDPCTGCAAYCCDTLSVPIDTPADTGNVDYLRFALGYPSVQVGVGPGGWTLLVRTRCAHLTQSSEGPRCGLFGQSERPWVCRGYDENNCGYKLQIGAPQHPGFVRFSLADWPAVAAIFTFDAHGTATVVPDHEAVRSAVIAAARALDPLAEEAAPRDGCRPE